MNLHHRDEKHFAHVAADGAPAASVAAVGDLRVAAARVRALLPCKDRAEPAFGELTMPPDRVPRTNAKAMFLLEGGDLLVALCASGVLRLERG